MNILARGDIMFKKFSFLLLAVFSVAFILTGTECAFGEAVHLAADSPFIRYYGRWEMKDKTALTGQGATYIRAKFTGSSELRADLSGKGVFWEYSIDGRAFQRLEVKGNGPLTLGKGLTKEEEHIVTLVRSSEGQAGISEFRGFILEKGGRFISPPQDKKRRLEFVGDSITAGAINLMPYNGTNYFVSEDGNMSYAPLLSRLLDADWSVVAKSGGGVVHNYDDPWPSDKPHAIDRYGWTFFHDAISKDNPAWDSRKFPVDAVIVALGTNDFSDPHRKPTKTEFCTGYNALLQKIRQMNPQAKIICLEPLPSHLPGEIRAWIADSVQAQHDDEVYFVPLNDKAPLLAPEEYTDGSTHPNILGHIKAAAYLKDKIAAIMEWE